MQSVVLLISGSFMGADELREWDSGRYFEGGLGLLIETDPFFISNTEEYWELLFRLAGIFYNVLELCEIDFGNSSGSDFGAGRSNWPGGFSRFQFPLKINFVLLQCILLLMMMPFQVTMLSNFSCS